MMFPPRLPTSQERADALLMRWRMARAAGIPADKRLEATMTDTCMRVGPLELDLVNRTASRGDRSFKLPPREFRLLEYMMQRAGQLVTRADLFIDVWHYKFVPQTNLVDIHMGKLRRKVDGPNEPQMIRTVRGAGFILNEAAPSIPEA